MSNANLSQEHANIVVAGAVVDADVAIVVTGVGYIILGACM